ncbi:MAG: glycosyltransferase [Pseudomonadota bacterium]
MSDGGLDILHVTSAHGVTDTRIFVKQARSLAAAGYRVGVLGPGSAPETVSKDGVWLRRLKRPSGRLGRFTWFRKTLYKHILEVGPRIVHLHDPDLLLMLPRLKRAGIKVIYDAHEDFSQAPVSRDWLGPRWMRRCAAWGLDMFERRHAALADGVVVADEQLLPRFGGAHVVRNFLVASEWPISPVRPRASHLRCIYVGDITRARGALRMCDAVRAGREHGLPLHLDFVGPVAPSLRTDLEAHPARPHITVHGALSRVDVATRMAKADVALCLPEPLPAYRSSLPVKLLEYFAMGLPVVATDTPRLRAEGRLAKGLKLVPWEAPAPQLVAAIQSAQNLADQARADLRATVMRDFNWSQEQAVLLGLYSEVLPEFEPIEAHAAE